MIRVRFNLGRGKNYRKWKVEDTIEGIAVYYDPEKVYLQMFGCQLYNNKETAEEIFMGANKRVCAWINCRKIAVTEKPQTPEIRGKEIMYNPRIVPYWFDSKSNNLDGNRYRMLSTEGRHIFEI